MTVIVDSHKLGSLVHTINMHNNMCVTPWEKGPLGISILISNVTLRVEIINAVYFLRRKCVINEKTHVIICNRHFQEDTVALYFITGIKARR